MTRLASHVSGRLWPLRRHSTDVKVKVFSNNDQQPYLNGMISSCRVRIILWDKREINIFVIAQSPLPSWPHIAYKKNTLPHLWIFSFLLVLRAPMSLYKRYMKAAKPTTVIIYNWMTCFRVNILLNRLAW